MTGPILASINSGNVKKLASLMKEVKKAEKDTVGPTFLNLLYGKFLIHRRECDSAKKYLKEKQIEAYLPFECKAKQTKQAK